MEVIASKVRAKGDLAGVFEFDDSDGASSATAYFYLYDLEESEGGRILDKIHIRSGRWNIRQEDVDVRWDKAQRMVGLFVFGTLWAAFDPGTRAKFGGGYGFDTPPTIPWS